MPFYIVKSEKYEDFYVINWDPATPCQGLLNVRPKLRGKLEQLFVHPEEYQPILDELNDAREKLMTVTIFSFRRGSEGKGYDHYAIERVLDHGYFVRPKVFSDNIKDAVHYPSHENAEAVAIGLGYKVIKS